MSSVSKSWLELTSWFSPAKLLMGLGWLDRFLAPLVLLAMILGVIIG
jgi:hypothetical protein